MEKIISKTTNFYADGTELKETSNARELDTNKVDNVEIYMEDVLRDIKEEFKDFIVKKYINARYKIKSYSLGNEIINQPVGYNIYKLAIEENENESIAIYIHESHIAIVETHNVYTDYGKCINIVEEYYISCNNDGILEYQPRETTVFINNQSSNAKPCDLYMYEPITNISVNFEGGYSHAFAYLPAESDKISICRYVGSQNIEPTVYADIKTEHDENNKVIKETTTFKTFEENITNNTVVKRITEFVYADDENKSPMKDAIIFND